MRCGHFARTLVFLEFIRNALPLSQAAQAGALNRRDVNEHVVPTCLGLNEAITFLLVEPLNDAGSHLEIVFQ